MKIAVSILELTDSAKLSLNDHSLQGLVGVFHEISGKYLQLYLNDYSYITTLATLVSIGS